MNSVGIALFGLGRAGGIHFQNILGSHRVNLLYIIDDRLEYVNERIKENALEDTRALTPDNASEIFKDDRVKAVIIATPTFTHETYIEMGLKAERAVFVEKPVAEDADTIDKLYKLADEKGKPLFCSLNRRLDPGLMEVYSRLRSGEVGNAYTVRSTSRDNPLPPIEYLRTSGGFFHDMAVHDLDYICWLLGEFPCQVSAQATANHSAIKEMDDIDTAVIIMKFPSGALSTSDFSRIAPYGYDQRVEILGSNGMLNLPNVPASAVQCSTIKGVQSSAYEYSFPERYRESYANAFNSFIDLVQGKQVTYVSGAEMLTVSKLASLCEESYRQGKVIEVPKNLLECAHPHAYTRTSDE